MSNDANLLAGDRGQFVYIHKKKSLAQVRSFMQFPRGPHAHRPVHVVSIIIFLKSSSILFSWTSIDSFY